MKTKYKYIHFEQRPIKKGMTIKDQTHLWYCYANKDNIHLGVTCENQRCADERIPLLLQIPAAKRFISCEPLLESIDLIGKDKSRMGKIGYLSNYLHPYFCAKCGHHLSQYTGTPTQLCGYCGSLEYQTKSGIDQVIIGCESGPKRRPCKLEWIANAIDQCDAAGVKVLVKQIPMPWCKKEYRGQWNTMPTIKELDEMIKIRSYVSHNPAEWPEKFRRREQI